MDFSTWQLYGVGFTVVVGILLHRSGRAPARHPAAALCFPVNGSVWERLKCLAVPMLLFSGVVSLCYGRALPNFVPARVLSLLFGMATIVVLLYTYAGVFGRRFALVDQLVFIFGVLEAYMFGTLLLSSGRLSDAPAVAAGYAGLIVLVGLFFLSSFRPPRIGLFQDPGTGRYGMNGR